MYLRPALRMPASVAGLNSSRQLRPGSSGPMTSLSVWRKFPRLVLSSACRLVWWRISALALCFTCLSEVLVFRHEARIKKALSTEWCVALILACYGLRQTFYAVLPSFNNPWVVLPVQLLHGITFGLYWSVGEAVSFFFFFFQVWWREVCVCEREQVIRPL